MKIIQCYISSFGKIKDYTHDFIDGINTIKQENGWGKSTIATFIKSMFYGLSNDKSRKVDENERLHYKPWNSTEKFGGYIVFEKNNKIFKIQRFFGNKQSEDTFELIDMQTGKTYDNPNIAVKVFDIDEEGFLSTTYFSQKDFEIKSNSSLTTKFNEIYEIQDSNSFDEALRLLETKNKEYSKTGGKGLIQETKNSILGLSEEINVLETSSLKVSQLKKDSQRLTGEISDLKEKYQLLSKELVEANKIENLKQKKASLDVFINQRSELLTSLDGPQKIINGNISNAKRVDEVSSLISEYDKLILHKENCIKDINAISSTKTNKKNYGKYLLFVLPLVFVIGIILGFAVNWVVGVAIFGAGAVLLGVVSFLYNKLKGQDGFLRLIEIKKAEIDECENKILNIKDFLDDFFAGFIVDKQLPYFDRLMLIKNSLDKIDALSSSLQSLQKQIDNLSVDKEIFNIANTEKDVQTISSQLENITNAINEKNKQLANVTANIRYYENDAERLLESESKRNELTEKLKEYQEDYNILTKTIEFFNIANDNLKTKYRLPLENSLNKYLNLINNYEITAKIDIDLNVKIIESKGEFLPNYYSKGYQNLIEICKRFALTDVIYKDDKPFIILDDPFYNLDEQKIENALNLLKKLTNEYQIIYFICHDSRSVN